MNILSLFDGMACGALAIDAAGIEIDKYVAYEVDKYAIQTAQYNFPFIEERGDVFKADFTEYAGFDYLIGGSPCTYWSIAQTKNRETVASGIGWELFSQYVRALHEAKPRFFLYENNKSMSAAIRASITETFGFEPILINSALVSAQNRQRLYWCGIRQADGTYKKADIQQPADRGILLKDILETGITWRDKSHTIDATYYKGGTLNGDKLHQNSTRLMAAEPVCIAQRGRYDESGKVFQHYEAQPTGKTNNLTTVSKDNLIAEPICVNSKSGRAGVEGLQPSLPVGTTEKGKAYALTANYANGSDNVGDYVTHTLEKHVKSCVAVAVNPLEKGNKARPLTASYYKYAPSDSFKKANPRMGVAEPVCVAQCGRYDESGRSIDAPIYEVKDGYITVKGNKYPIKLVDGFYIIRKLTVRECMRLQTVPEWYDWPVSKSQAYKMLGNGWTVEVIAHILQGLK
jgi:DNA-cytosine methyltransferase